MSFFIIYQTKHFFLCFIYKIKEFLFHMWSRVVINFTYWKTMHCSVTLANHLRQLKLLTSGQKLPGPTTDNTFLLPTPFIEMMEVMTYQLAVSKNLNHTVLCCVVCNSSESRPPPGQTSFTRNNEDIFQIYAKICLYLSA